MSCPESGCRGAANAILVMALIFSAPFLLRGESYSRFDEKIVDAYNSKPKRTQDVYVYAMQILEKARMDRSSEGKEWEDKAQKLITISAYAEVDRALDDDQLREAYIWAMRGLANGASRGELGEVKIKQIYDSLKDMAERLGEDPEVKELKKASTRREILDYHSVRQDSRYHSRDERDVAGRPVEKRRRFEVVEGPSQDASGRLFVKVRYPQGAILLLRYIPKRGWRVAAGTDISEETYYASWQECAESNAGKEDLPASSLLPVKQGGNAQDRTIYYVPAVGGGEGHKIKTEEGRK